MNLASIASSHSTQALQPQPGPSSTKRETQTDEAKAHLTLKSTKLLPDSLLDARTGRSTLAGTLNDQVRFRVNRTGQVAAWTLAPDSPTAAALVQSKAGHDLLRQLETAMRSTGTLEEVSNLKGFILAKDNESVLAGAALASLDSPTDEDGKKLQRLGELHRTKVAGRVLRSWAPTLTPQIARAGAWNSEGWITFMPDTSRAMLIAAGAYDPNRHTEKRLLRAASWADYLAGNGPHEVQHSVSGPTATAYVGTAKWMEEGTANVFGRTPTFLSRNAKASGLTLERYASKLSHEPSFDAGWKSWKRPTLSKEKEKDYDKETSRNYGKSQVVLRDLVRLAGGDFRSKAGKDLAFELLQRKSMRYTAGVLANAIIAEHDLDPKLYERMRERVQGAVDIKGGVDELAKEFGIE